MKAYKTGLFVQMVKLFFTLSFLDVKIYVALSHIGKSGQYNYLTISMENWLQVQILSQPGITNLFEPSTVAYNPFGQYIYLDVIFSQMTKRITTLEQSLEIIMKQLTQLKARKGLSSNTGISDKFQSDQKRKTQITTIKMFPKHLKCPIPGCKRCYSSRIAMRSHLRKFHTQEFKNNRD